MMNQFHADTVNRFLDVLYSGDYSFDITSETQERHRSIMSDEPPATAAVLHSRMAIIADYYDVQPLKRIAFERVDNYWLRNWNPQLFVNILKDCIDCDVLDTLKDGLLHSAVKHIKELVAVKGFSDLQLSTSFSMAIIINASSQAESRCWSIRGSRLENILPESARVTRMIEALYRGDYLVDIPDDLISSHKVERCSLKGQDRPWTEPAAHARVAIIANYYDIETVKGIANEKLKEFWDQEWDGEEYVEFLKSAIDSGVAHILVDGVVDAALEDVGQLQQKEDFKRLRLPASFSMPVFSQHTQRMTCELDRAKRDVARYEKSMREAMKYLNKNCPGHGSVARRLKVEETTPRVTDIPDANSIKLTPMPFDTKDA
ncbi:hypothetical protein KEM56_006369 [Ascosphaera pollenicola]|nr:hypothetical protein KEM56_006369 [Ascosphaera pollenicola]